MTDREWIILSVIGCVAWVLFFYVLIKVRDLDRRAISAESVDRLRYMLDVGNDPRAVPGWPQLIEELIDLNVGWDIVAWSQVPNAALNNWREIAVEQSRRNMRENVARRVQEEAERSRAARAS